MSQREVLLSQELLKYIALFQVGVLEDMTGFACMEIPSVSCKVAETLKWHQTVRAIFLQWHDKYGVNRLPLLFHFLPKMRRPILLHAIMTDQCEIMKFLESDCATNEADLIELSIASGQLRVFKYLYDLQFAKCHPIANYILTATKFGHLVFVQYLRDLWPDAISAPNIMNTAATNGHLNVVKYLHLKEQFKCSRFTMDNAAGNGHLDIVKFLHTYRTEGCTHGAIDLAAKNGHIQIVKWLDQYRNEGWSHKAVSGAATYGHLKILKYLLERKPHIGCIMYAMDDAAANGHLSIVQYLHQQRSEGCTENALTGSRYNGHEEVTTYLELHKHDLVHRLCCVCGLFKPRNHFCAPLERIGRPQAH